YEVPFGVFVTEVRGPDVRYWTRNDKSLQIWLKEPCKETTVLLGGWLPYGKGAPKAKAGAGGLVLPAVPLPDSVNARVGRLTAAPGLAVTPERLEALVPAADAAVPGALQYTTQQVKYGGTFQVRPAALTPEVEILTSGEVTGTALAFVSTID